MLNILSLGAGVQSSTMALMAAKGELTPMPDFAIFADVGGDEPEEVYTWLDDLKLWLPFPTYIVRADAERSLSDHDVWLRTSKKTGLNYRDGHIPAFIKNDQGKVGMLHRKCTADFKIVPIVKELRKLGNIKRGEKEVQIKQWMGISTDEVQRMKPFRYPFVEHIFPLIENNISRRDCIQWMEDNYSIRPPRSACVFCPYHSDREWAYLKNSHPDDFDRAVAHEKRMQAAADKCQVLRGTPYLHRSCVPIDEIDFDPDSTQVDMFGNECEGLCGV